MTTFSDECNYVARSGKDSPGCSALFYFSEFLRQSTGMAAGIIRYLFSGSGSEPVQILYSHYGCPFRGRIARNCLFIYIL